MFIKRPLVNTEEDRNAKYDIQELIHFERFCRDNEQWEEMRKCFAKDSFVDISWFQGTGDDFVTASKNMNIYGPHKIYNTLTYINGVKAVSITMASLQIRMPINGTMYEVTSDTKLLFRTQKSDGQWYIVGFTSIYDKDVIAPIIPSVSVSFPDSALEGLRESYACLSYAGASSGRTINNDLPGRDRPDLVEKSYKDMEEWLYA